MRYWAIPAKYSALIIEACVVNHNANWRRHKLLVYGLAERQAQLVVRIWQDVNHEVYQIHFNYLEYMKSGILGLN